MKCSIIAFTALFATIRAAPVSRVACYSSEFKFAAIQFTVIENGVETQINIEVAVDSETNYFGQLLDTEVIIATEITIVDPPSDVTCDYDFGLFGSGTLGGDTNYLQIAQQGVNIAESSIGCH